MSADMAVRSAVLTALQSDAALMALTQAVFDVNPVRSAPPYVVLSDAVGSEWGAKEFAGSEIRFSITIVDASDVATRMSAIQNRVASIISALGAVDGNWYIVTARQLRSRLSRRGQTSGEWRHVADYQLRVVRH